MLFIMTKVHEKINLEEVRFTFSSEVSVHGCHMALSLGTSGEGERHGRGKWAGAELLTWEQKQRETDE